MEGYTAKIAYASKELSAKEKILLKDTTSCISLDTATDNSDLIIEYAFHAIISVHNDNSENKDYTKTVVVTKTGERYVTGSDTFTNTLGDIVNEMTEAGEGDNITIKVYRRPSKKYSGKSFITCTIV